MSKYYFQAGNTPVLSSAELESVVGQEVETITPYLFAIELADDQLSPVFDRLGGTVKAFKALETISLSQEESLISVLVAQLIAQKEQEKITFSVAQLGDTQRTDLALTEIKRELKAQGHSSRFIDGPRRGLSASVLLHQGIIELVVLYLEDEIVILRTLEIQDIDHWTEKDRQKPYADRKKGMLPPKVARMMLNLAVGQDELKDKRVYDPFCGTGTVLLEALEMGADVIGSDLDEKAVVGSKTNLAWFAERLSEPGRFEVFKGDVSRVLPQDIRQKIDYIVTEPYLGKPRPQFNKLPAIFDGLEKMYLGAFKRWTQFLNPGAKVAIVFPRVEAENQTFSLEKLIDKLEKYGYTSQVNLGEWQYHRPQAVVQRDIMLFTFNSK